MTTAGWLQTGLQDTRYALRSFRKHPGFAAVALLSLMLGIGATSSIFSVIYGVLISPYPYAKPDEIWAIGLRSHSGREGRGIYPIEDYLELTKLPAFADVMATSWETVLLTGDYAPESLRGVVLSGNAFNFLGVPPVAGRTIQPSDIRPSGEPEPVVVLSYRLWQRLFQGDPSAVGKTLRLNDRPHTIIGMMPPRFGWYGNDGLWLPMGTIRGDSRPTVPIARLAPGVSAAAAQEQLHALHLRLAQERPAAFPKDGFASRLTNYLDVTVASGEMRNSLRLLFGAVALLLLIACVNVANLQLARATARGREMALRLSIGAGRGRLLRQLLTESLMLSLLGGALGVLFAWGATKAIVALMPEFYLPNEARVTLNLPVLLFSLAVSLVSGILFGLAPALRSSRPDLVEALKDSSRGAGTSERSGRLRGLLVVAEVALSVILLVTATLTIRSFVALQQVDVGFQPDATFLVGVPLQPRRYATLEQRNLFGRELLERVKSLPGVRAVALGNGGLPFGGPQSPYTIDGQPAPAGRTVTVNLISADYLRAMGIPLRQGRSLTDAEVDRGDGVALINEAARRLWREGDDPIGKRIRLSLLEQPPGDRTVLIDTSRSPELTVVGIVGNVRNAGLRSDVRPAVLVPYTFIAPTQRLLAIRAYGDPLALLNPLRAQVRAIDKEQPLGRPQTVEEVLGFQTVQPRFTMSLFSFFGALGLSLAAVGIYSVVSYSATQRTHEIGVRMALGARPIAVVGLMLAMGGKLVALGLGIGLVGAVFAARLVQSQLFGVAVHDPMSLAAVATVLGVTALAACYVPARRAGSVDPLVALRHE
jgi:putative ABC transport system permease protein